MKTEMRREMRRETRRDVHSLGALASRSLAAKSQRDVTCVDGQMSDAWILSVVVNASVPSRSGQKIGFC